MEILFLYLLNMLSFKKPNFNSNWDIKWWNKNSGSIPSPHPGHAWDIILKWPYVQILHSDLKINLHCTCRRLDVAVLQILWKSTQGFFRFHAPKIFYQKILKTLSNAQFWIKKKQEMFLKQWPPPFLDETLA